MTLATRRRQRLRPGQSFAMASNRPGLPDYDMSVTPDGYVVHQGLGCEGEHFSGVRGCYHSRESEKQVTQALTRYDASAVPTRT